MNRENDRELGEKNRRCKREEEVKGKNRDNKSLNIRGDFRK